MYFIHMFVPDIGKVLAPILQKKENIKPYRVLDNAPL